MGLAVVYSRASCGIDAPPVSIEVHLSKGLPGLSIVGLPEAAVKESKDRVRSALLNTHYEFPSRKITINLAPADLPKRDGGRFDLPIALGILAASEQIPCECLEEYEFAGELGLSGEIRYFQGALPFALATKSTGRKLVLPEANADEAGLIQQLEVIPANHLLQICGHLDGDNALTIYKPHIPEDIVDTDLDLADVRGQFHAKRALEIAAAGQHSLLMIGPPGTGKTMLASRLPGILPQMTEAEALERSAIASICGERFSFAAWRIRPFRAPHHTASSIALVGGGTPPRPGEISLAHNGVLFLDELPEFQRSVLEVLREPLESGQVTISRAAYQAQFPAKFQLVAAMNPCPCGYLGDERGRCNCTFEQVQRYQARISGPLFDRIDMHVEVPILPKGTLTDQQQPVVETSAKVRLRVTNARELQTIRGFGINANLTNKQIEKVCKINKNDIKLIENAMEKLGLSARAYHRILKVARTIADLDQSENIQTQHLTEALTYRKFAGVN